MERVETPRLILRPFTEADAQDVYDYARDPRVGPPAGWKPHGNVEESLEIIRTVFNRPYDCAFVLKETGRVIGSGGFVDRHRTGLPGPDDEIGYALSPAYWGRGLVPEAVRALLRFGFERLGLATQWAAYYDGNLKSRRVMVKCGMTYRLSQMEEVPLLGERRMTHYYALTREEWQAL